MKKINIKLFFTSFIFIQSTCLFAQNDNYPQNVQLNITAVENNINGSALQQRMNFYKVKGLSIAVIKNYQVEWAKGYGWADVEQQKPVTTITRFQAASVSKSVNGMGILTLYQQGKLDLYKDINQYLTTWQFPYDAASGGQKISTANLLSHTAGLSVHGFGGYNRNESLPGIIEILNGTLPANSPPVRSQFPPGIKFQYSGGGIEISQLLLHDITGEDYGEYMQKNVLKPVGMMNSFYTKAPADEQEDLSTAYDNNGQQIPGKYHVYPEKAAAGLWTTPTDLAKFIINIQKALRGDQGTVLTQQTAQLMTTPYIVKAAALGVFVTNKSGTRYFNHEGENAGFVSTYYGSFKDGNGVVVMSNTYAPDILQEVVQSIAQAYNWSGNW